MASVRADGQPDLAFAGAKAAAGIRSQSTRRRVEGIRPRLQSQRRSRAKIVLRAYGPTARGEAAEYRRRIDGPPCTGADRRALRHSLRNVGDHFVHRARKRVASARSVRCAQLSAASWMGAHELRRPPEASAAEISSFRDLSFERASEQRRYREADSRGVKASR